MGFFPSLSAQRSGRSFFYGSKCSNNGNASIGTDHQQDIDAEQSVGAIVYNIYRGTVDGSMRRLLL